MTLETHRKNLTTWIVLFVVVLSLLCVTLSTFAVTGRVFADEASCEAPGSNGTWTTIPSPEPGRSPSTVCVCPAGTTNSEGSCRSDREALCRNSGGTWTTIPSPEPGRSPSTVCTCPSGSTYVADRCQLSPSDTTAPSTEEPYFTKNDCNGENISANAAEGSGNECGILDYLALFINFLSAMVGIVVVGSIIYGGIQYSSAGSDPQKISSAKSRIRNAIIALIFFVFTYAFLNYLVPGGVLR